MAQVEAVAGGGYARYTYRLRVSSAACTALAGEWDRCRWVWNECVAKSRAVHLHNKATGENQTCGPAQLDKMLTEARKTTPWLREGSSVVQQQVIRDFGRARTKAHKDITERLPVRQRAGMPKWKTKRETLATLNYTRRGFRLQDGRLHLAGGIVVTVVWSRELPAEPSSVRVYQDSLGHWYGSFVVPAQIQPLPRTGRALGVDWGVKETATTTSDAHDLPHAEHGGKARAKLTRYDRMMARRKPKKGEPGSKGYRAAKKLRAKAHKKVARGCPPRTWGVREIGQRACPNTAAGGPVRCPHAVVECCRGALSWGVDRRVSTARSAARSRRGRRGRRAPRSPGRARPAPRSASRRTARSRPAARSRGRGRW